MFLGAHVERITGRKLDVWLGECHVHAGIRSEDLEAQLAAHPDAEFLIHPECGCSSTCIFLRPDAKLLSTEGMVRYAAQSPAQEFVVATEVGILHRLNKKAPGKRFIPVREDPICQYMKRTTLEKVYESLRDLKHVITVPEEIAAPARRALEAMLALG